MEDVEEKIIQDKIEERSKIIDQFLKPKKGYDDGDYSCDSTTYSTLINRFADDKKGKDCDKYFKDKKDKLESNTNKYLEANSYLRGNISDKYFNVNVQAIYSKYEDKKIAIKNREEQVKGTLLLLSEYSDNNNKDKNKNESCIDYVLEKKIRRNK
jgi:hypothetical protein